MTQTIWRPCYATREEVKRALDVKAAAYNDEQVDRQIISGSESVDDLCKRQFFPEDKVQQVFLDWPNYQYAYPWRIWLDRWELAVAPATQLTSGAVVIPQNAYFCKPEIGPPFTYIELDRSKNSSFGNSSTPQRDIQIQGTFGFWNRQQPIGSLIANIPDTTTTTFLVANSASPGVGDLIFVDSERMIVQNKTMADTGIVGTGLSASAADVVLSVPNSALFTVGEILRYDMERLLITEIFSPTQLLVKRAWDGTILAGHTSADIWAARQLTVQRGAVGTTAATHPSGTAMMQLIIPGLVKELAVAESVVGLIQEPSGYSGGVTGMQRLAIRTAGSINESMPGAGIPDLRSRVCNRYARKVRSRVI